MMQSKPRRVTWPWVRTVRTVRHRVIIRNTVCPLSSLFSQFTLLYSQLFLLPYIHIRIYKDFLLFSHRMKGDTGSLELNYCWPLEVKLGSLPAWSAWWVKEDRTHRSDPGDRIPDFAWARLTSAEGCWMYAVRYRWPPGRSDFQSCGVNWRQAVTLSVVIACIDGGCGLGV